MTVPTAIPRIADAWPAHNEVLQMLGAGDRIVATVLTPASMRSNIAARWGVVSVIYVSTVVQSNLVGLGDEE